MVNVFGLELNTTKANVKSSEIKGIFVKESELTVPDELVIYGFFEIFQASKLSIETLNMNIAPPKYAMKLHDNSRAHRSEEHTSELQSRFDLVCRLLLERKNTFP